MNMLTTERRQVENEMIFRRANESVVNALDEVNANHIEDENPHLINTEDMLLHFMCECSDENCVERIQIKLSVYRDTHENRKAFILIPGHQVEAIEQVVKAEKNYSVVKKDKIVADPGTTLNQTPVDNV